MSDAFRLHPSDNVAVALHPLSSGTVVMGVKLRDDIPAGHKFALTDIPPRGKAVKYGYPIGGVKKRIHQGEWVHTHNLRTRLGKVLSYAYNPGFAEPAEPLRAVFSGYKRAAGRPGIRNEIWIIPTVGCVNGAAQRLERASAGLAEDGVYAFPHPYGCSQMGADLHTTQRLLSAMVRHPNAGGVLVLGLGCENNHIAAFKDILGPYVTNRVKFLSAQSVDDELEAGLSAIRELASVLSSDTREPFPLSELAVGLKCGGSDGFSGLTANPLMGLFADRLIASGGTAVMTEVPEMFGAETILMNRCADASVFHQTVALINNYKRYFKRHGQVIYENPSPGNKEGGITTLEEKSLGCVQKGGTGTIRGVLAYAAPAAGNGLYLLDGPGNDIVAVTALMASGCQLILFSTGRGTPLGSPVPVIKLSARTGLAEMKSGWIDFDAGVILHGEPPEEAASRLMERVLLTASGAKTLSERNGYRDMAIFKNGVTV